MMKKKGFIVLLVVLTLLATMSTALASESRTVYRTGLSGEPNGSGSDAHGNAVFMFEGDGTGLNYKLVVNGLDEVIMAHIHVAAEPGGDGPPVLWLYPDAPPPSHIEGTFNGLLGSRMVTSSDLTGAAGITSLADLMMAIEQGRAYVNVHTIAFPAGEIRGTIH
jgi:hypothetical protein